MTSRKTIAILSIDGGGIRGIIPAIVLQCLETELQKLDGVEARIADYFSLIAGTSTGALITAMLTAPVDNYARPLPAKKIVQEFENKGPLIFSNIDVNESRSAEFTPGSSRIPRPIPSPPEESSIFGAFKRLTTNALQSGLKLAYGPIYNGSALREVHKLLLGETLLAKTATDVLIPTYDLKELKPRIFTSREAREIKSRIKLADVSMSSASAPCFFPVSVFNADGRNNRYELVDGGVSANNPTLLAIREATTMFGNEGTSATTGGNRGPDFSKHLIISLGTGSARLHGGYNLLNGSNLEWVAPSSGVPLVDVLMRGSDNMVDTYTQFVLGDHNYRQNYLRIQDHTLGCSEAKLDDAGEENLEPLKRIGLELLNSPVSVPNSVTGLKISEYNDVEYRRPSTTYRKALQDMAKRLSQLRKQGLLARYQ